MLEIGYGNKTTASADNSNTILGHWTEKEAIPSKASPVTALPMWRLGPRSPSHLTRPTMMYLRHLLLPLRFVEFAIFSTYKNTARSTKPKNMERGSGRYSLV